MPRMNYEAEPQDFDKRLQALAHAIHAEVCPCDDKRCTVTSEIYDWLESGDLSDNPTTEALIAEWREYDRAPEA